jgi:BASS family bile acid:Na+ symporter
MVLDIDTIQIHFSQDEIWLLNLCLAIVMFGVALDIRLSDFFRLWRSPKSTLLGILLQFILLPALTFVLIQMLQPKPSIALGMIMVAACPGGNISNFMTNLSGGNTALSVSLTAFATIAAIFMTPFNLQFWGSMYEPTAAILRTVSINPIDIFKTIALILGLPLVLGMWWRSYKPEIAIKMSKWLKPLSILIFIGFVVVAFSMNIDIFLKVIHLVILIVFIHNAMAISSGYLLARACSLPLEDQKTLSIETGIQNSGLGLLLIFTFFEGLGGMVIVAAWWGIWHIISGLAISWFWSKKKRHNPAI